MSVFKIVDGYCVYMAHNIINNKVYVGKTKNPHKRWDKHVKVAGYSRNKEKFYFQRAIAKYGVSNFIFSIIQYFSSGKETNLAEKYWIKFFKSNQKEFGYNLTEGGEGNYGRVVSEETRMKMRQKATGRKHTPETIEKLKIINKGKIPSNLEQLRMINTGKTLTAEHKQKLSEARKGIIFTEEHKKNMSNAQKGLWDGEKNPFFGKSHTEEVKQMSRGENNKQAKLTSSDVLEIRKKYNSGNYTQQKLANIYKVSRGQIGRIVRNVDWKHVGDK